MNFLLQNSIYYEKKIKNKLYIKIKVLYNNDNNSFNTNIIFLFHKKRIL